MSESNKHTMPTFSRSRVFIPCRVMPGWFREEWIVLIDAADPKNSGKTIEVQMFADATDVIDLEGTPTKEHPVKGYVRVSLAGSENGFALILLPQFGIPVGEY